MQAQMCPRRDRASVVWPEDGAWVMPMAYLVQPTAAEKLRPVSDYLTGDQLAGVLDHHAYPATRIGAGVSPALGLTLLPDGAQLKWPGWEFFRHPDLVRRSQHTADLFFAAWNNPDEARSSCG
jgi:hypothetical protein